MASSISVKKDLLYSAIEASIAPSKGVSLLPMPTGSGKSHNIAEILSDRINNSEARQTFIISPQVKLMEDIFKKINKKCSANGIDECTFIVRAIDLHWMNFFSDNTKVFNIRTLLKKEIENQKVLSETTSLLEKLSQKYHKYFKYPDASKRLKTMEEDEKLIDERTAFTRILRKVFVSKFPADETTYVEQCNNAINAYPFLAELFPELAFHKYKVIGITVAKLHKTLTSGLLKGGVMPYWNHITKDALVIIDESDMSKENAINNLIEESINNFKDIDKWNLAYKLCNNLDKLDLYFHQEEDKPLIPWRDALKKSLTVVINRFSKEFTIHEKLDGSKLEAVNQGGAIYHDRDSIFTSSSNMTHVYFGDSQIGTDFLCSSEYESASSFPLTYVDARLNIFFTEFIDAIDQALEEYINLLEQIEEERSIAMKRSVPARVTEYTALCQILDYIEVNDSERDFLSNHRGQKKYYAPSNLAFDDIKNKDSMYYKGITVTEVATIHGNRRKCKLSSIRLKTFPENVIIELVKKKGCMVLLSSATADIKDPIHNYDLDYIADELGDLWYGSNLIDQKTKKELYEHFDRYNSHPDVNFDVWPSDSKQHVNYHEDLLELLGNGPVLMEAESILAKFPYMRGKFVNMVRFYYEFLKSNDAHAGLYVTPYIWPRKYKRDSSQDDKQGEELLLKVFGTIQKHKFGKNFELPEKDSETGSVYSCLNVAFLSGDSFVNDLKHVTSMLSSNNNAKMLCFICYSSGTVGVNYEYNVKDLDTTFCKAQKSRGKTCNFDTIYLEHPTNFIVGDDDNRSSYDKAAFYVSILEEGAHISISQKINFVSHFLRRKMELNCDAKDSIPDNRFIPWAKSSIYKTKAYREFCVSRLIQALGRITRTPISRSLIHVVIDEKSAASIAATRLPEASTWLYKFIKDQCAEAGEEKDDAKTQKKIKFERQDYDNNKTIERIVHRSIRPIFPEMDLEEKDSILKARYKIREMNEIVLTGPVRESLDGLSSEMAALYYDTEEFEMPIHPADAVHLECMVKDPFIRQYFELKGYETKKRDDRFVLYPKVIQQLYVGRIGEQVLYALAQSEGISLSELPESLHEAADWTFENRIFIDVKFWSENPKNQESNLSNWSKKIERCGGSYILVNVPLTKDANWLKQHLRPAPGYPAVINGLIDVRSGKTNPENLRNLINLIKGL